MLNRCRSVYWVMLVVVAALLSVTTGFAQEHGDGGAASGDAPDRALRNNPPGVLDELATIRQRGDYVAAGTGLRNTGTGSITITGIPVNATVTHAYLYWAILANSNLGSTITFNGFSRQGFVVGSDDDLCWGYTRTFGYRANVTNLVSGNGTYNVSLSTPNGLNEGASLVVVYSVPDAPYRDIVIYDGVASTDFTGDFVSNTMTIPPYTYGDAKTTYIVADGQTFVDRTLFEGMVIAENAFDGSDGDLWDTLTLDVTQYMTPYDNAITVGFEQTGIGSTDCLGHIAQVYSSGSTLINSQFDNGLAGWGFFGDISRWWSGGGVNIVRNGWTEPTMFQVLEQPVPSNQVIEATARFTNNSNVRKTIQLNVRNTDYSQQMICSVVLNPGESRFVKMQDVTTSVWPRIHYTIRTFDRDNIAAIRVDDAFVYLRDDITITERVCTGSNPATFTNYLLNGDFSYSGWRYWVRWGSIIGNLSNGELSMYRPNNAGTGGVFARVYQYFPKFTYLQLSFEVTNNSGSMKSLNALLREEGWAQSANCNFNVYAGSTHLVNVRLTTTSTWGNAVVSLRPLQADAVPLVIDNVAVRRMATNNPPCSNTVISPSNPTLSTISAQPYIQGEVTEFNFSGAPQDATVSLDCNADGIFESDDLSCAVMSDTIEAQITYADGTTGTIALEIDMMSASETLAYLQEIAPTSEDALADVAELLGSGDVQATFDALFELSQQTNDPMLASWLNRLAYATGQ